ncbi:SU10 major capsid protein [Methylovulum psychrotolerans]|uniref:Phage major capsid protein n=1 Tax=Methylovulum psychrotolerans TaxID=1704499 RepID=A0A1Z4C0F5_9GAMM|nr:DUF5309 family protein [Methylovulum psychrotolerans]ASF47002.1 hypothetical protein CEK71_13490 [Methylovulum psychrotolerans]
MATQQNSFDFNNRLRSFDNELAVLIANSPALLSLAVRRLASGLVTLNSRTPVTQNKHEWTELTMTPELGYVSGTHTNSVTTLALVDATGFVADMILAFEGTDEVMKVTAVSGNNLTVVRGYGGSTAAALADNILIRVVSRPRPEGSNPDPNANTPPAVNYNYTEIFDDTFMVSNTLVNTGLGGMSDVVDTNLQQSMLKVIRRMNNATIYGRRVQRSATEKGTMGGILQLVTNRINAAGVALESATMNDAVEAIFKSGGTPNAIVCNTNQARRITAFQEAKMFVLRADNTIGSSVSQFQSDLPMGAISTIVVEPSFPRTKIAFLDTEKMYLEPMSGRSLGEWDATLPGADNISRRILGEYTLELLNGGAAHAIIDNLEE